MIEKEGFFEILKRQENIEPWEDEAWIDDESFDDLFPEIAFDDIDLSLEEE